jgi:hypothetical protein
MRYVVLKSLHNRLKHKNKDTERMYNMTYNPILIAPVLAAVLAMIGATTNVHASVDCTQSTDDPRCQAAANSSPSSPSSPPEGEGMQLHSASTGWCLAGGLLGTWVLPANGANVPQEAASCQALP